MRAVLFCLLTGVLVLAGCGGSEPDLPELGPAPEFQLTAHDDEGAFDSVVELEGHPYVTYFFFTSCSGPCPAMTEAMVALTERFDDAERLRFVGVTVDPATDTPERLRQYAQQYGATDERLTYLTGADGAIQRLARDGFKLGSWDEPMLHSTRFILVDGEGQIRGYYNGVFEEDLAALNEAIAALVG